MSSFITANLSASFVLWINLFKRSLSYKCESCGAEMVDALAPVTDDTQKICDEAKELASQIDFKVRAPKITSY